MDQEQLHDAARHVLTAEQHRSPATPREFALFDQFMGRAGLILSRIEDPGENRYSLSRIHGGATATHARGTQSLPIGTEPTTGAPLLGRLTTYEHRDAAALVAGHGETDEVIQYAGEQGPIQAMGLAIDFYAILGRDTLFLGRSRRTRTYGRDGWIAGTPSADVHTSLQQLESALGRP
jgi:hypothetical protein